MDLENKKFLKEFVSKIKKFRSPATERPYSRYGNRFINPVRDSFTLEEIESIIREGTPEQLRELSRYYYRTSGVYRNTIDLYATMSKEETMVSPIFYDGKTVSDKQVTKTFCDACKFVEDLHLRVNLPHMKREMFINGVYFGILREGPKGGYTIQDLPIQYCRVQFKDEHDLEVLEFNINYFDSIRDAEYQKAALESYPKEIQEAWKKRKKLESPWIELGPGMGGVSFSCGDRTPPFASSIPSIYQLDEAVKREADRDENELYKILIQKMPIDNKGELVFQLDEVQDIHESVAEMLRDTDTVNVLTTFGDTKLESLQDATAATQSSSRIKKYTETAYDELGVPEILFNCDTAAGLEYAIKRQEAMINEINSMFSVWIKYLINERFAKPKFYFDFEILQIDIFNQKEVQEKYFQAAQYGYSKMYAGVAMGIKQLDQLSLLGFENDILEMHTRMVPLQSTYTSSVKDIQARGSESKSETNVPKSDLNNGSVEKTTTQTEVTEEKTNG